MPDVDIDFFDRDGVLKLFKHAPASIIKDNKIEKHKTGVYFHAIPTDPINGYASLDYKKAEQRLINQPIKKMSHLTNKILSSIDYERIKEKRKENFEYLQLIADADDRTPAYILSKMIDYFRIRGFNASELNKWNY